MDNRRKHMRLPISVDAELKTDDKKIIKGSTINISFSGMLVELNDKPEIQPGDRCKITLILQQNSNVEICFECKLVHETGNLFGLEFICLLGLDGYENFKNLMTYNSPDPEALMAELEKNPGIENIAECSD